MKNLFQRMLNHQEQPLTMDMLPGEIISKNVKKQLGEFEIEHLKGELLLYQSTLLECSFSQVSELAVKMAFILNAEIVSFNDILVKNSGISPYDKIAFINDDDLVFDFHLSFSALSLYDIKSCCEQIVPVLKLMLQQEKKESLLPQTIEQIIRIENMVKGMYYDYISQDCNHAEPVEKKVCC